LGRLALSDAEENLLPAASNKEQPAGAQSSEFETRQAANA